MSLATRSRSSTIHWCKTEETCIWHERCPRRWSNILDKALRSYGRDPTRTDRCCYELYSLKSRKQAWEHWVQGASHSRTVQKTPSLNHVIDHKWKLHLKKTLEPKAGSPATGKYLFGTGGNEVEQRVLTRLRKYFQVGSADWNDVAFTRQRIRWSQDAQNGPYIEVSQNKAVDELEETPVERNTRRSLLGQVNWLQSRTPFQCCYTFPDALRWQLLQQEAM